MELVTAHQLWRDYDPYALPLDETILSDEKHDGYETQDVYFNGEATTDGKSRIFARRYIPSSPNGAGVVLASETESSLYASILVKEGYEVLDVDFAGKRDGRIYTIYPKSMEYANLYSPESNFARLPDRPEKSAHYAYACVFLRGFVYLESKKLEKIGFFGVKKGAFAVYKAAFVMQKAKFAIALYNSTYIPSLDLTGADETVWGASLDNGGYASRLTVPTYAVIGSNDPDDALESVSRLHEASSDSVYMHIDAHRSGSLDAAARKSVMSFMDYCVREYNYTPSTPILTAKASERQLYYEVKVDHPEWVKDVNLYYSYGEEKGEYRNWIRLPLERISESEYLVRADVYQVNEPILGFVNVSYADGRVFSSDLVDRIPRAMGIDASEISKTRLIYDVDSGTDGWIAGDNLTDGSNQPELIIEKCASGIEGVRSSTDVISTLSIGDVHTRGERDGALQALVYSPEYQTLYVEVTCHVDDEYKSYSTSLPVSSFGEWSKLTLSAGMLRSEEGFMAGWDKAVRLKIVSESPLYVNTLLWI